jgi:hypothetical protein
MWVSGLTIGFVALVAILAGALGGLTGAMAVAAAVLLLSAGRIAESDRKAGRKPSGGGSSGGERPIGWLVFVAIALLIASACHGISQMPTR